VGFLAVLEPTSMDKDSHAAEVNGSAPDIQGA